MKRIICLDIGDKRIGIAMSDPFGMTAQALATLQRTTFRADAAKILEILKEYQVGLVLIGLPLNSESQEGPQAKKVRHFEGGLAKFLKEKNHAATIEWVDESFSSREAEVFLLEADLSRKKRKKVIDKMAAAVVLQNYLDEHG
ncbi:MAG: Holliday junction resolvase RuvX [Deltaproteobacteria bacterium]|nr:Holliday junction resolvase RuvX [Deltaproteobacteria bacterium]